MITSLLSRFVCAAGRQSHLEVVISQSEWSYSELRALSQLLAV